MIHSTIELHESLTPECFLKLNVTLRSGCFCYKDLSEHDFTSVEKKWFCKNIQLKKLKIDQECSKYKLSTNTIKGWLKKYSTGEAFYGSSFEERPSILSVSGFNELKENLKKRKNLMPQGPDGRRGNVPAHEILNVVNEQIKKDNSAAERPPVKAVSIIG